MLDQTSDPYVRVTDTKTNHDVSVRKSVLDSAGDALKPAAEVHGKPAPAVDLAGDPLPPTYAADKPAAAQRRQAEPTVQQMREEIDRRNAGRGEDDQIQVAPPGNKPELRAALVADDQAHGLNHEES